jgi:putative endonuclease
MAYVYILKSVNYEKTYTGSTTDLERRLMEHNLGLSTFSKRYRPWRLVYQEQYERLEEARKRERYLKSAAGRRFIKKHSLI